MHVITRIWKDQPGAHFCVSTKSQSGKWRDNFFKRSELPKVKAFVEKNLDKDVYFCPHGFSRPRRLKKFAEIPRLLWADLDEIDPRDLPENQMPTIAWESSPGRYAALWRLSDASMTEDLNRDLTYTLDADKGGWDLTQVLRFPGTNNYKYDSTPKVKMLWSDGPDHKFEDISSTIKKKSSKGKTDSSKAYKIYKKYEKKLSGFARRELLNGKPKAGKRSQVFWRLVNECLEVGMSQDECFEILRVSPWNKFSRRKNGDEQLRNELEKATKRHMRVEDDEEPGEDLDSGDEDKEEGHVYLARSIADVQEENIEWIWYPYLARGQLSILEGDPDTGKSYLAHMVSKAICDGERLPSVKKGMPRITGKVAYFDIENSSATVTKRRLTENGMKALHNFFQEEEPFSIDDEDELDYVYDAIDELRPALVVFDTINTYMGRADTHKSSEVQNAFKKFRDIARRFDCAVLVLRHLTKSTKERAMYRGQGSIAFSGLARVVMTVGISPDDADTRVMGVTKLNIARKPKSLTYIIESLPDTMKLKDRSRFHWGDFVDWTTDEIISAAPEKTTDRTQEVMDFIADFLEDGPESVDDIKRAAEARSIPTRTLYRGAEELGVKRESKGFGKKKRSMWSLPYKKRTVD